MKNQHFKIFCPEGSDLASRATARKLRAEIEEAISAGKTAQIDLTNVISISESYADELFAVLVEDHDLKWFSDNIKLLYQSSNSEYVLLTIATAIRRRLENQKSSTIKASVDELIAAKNKHHGSNNFYCCA